MSNMNDLWEDALEEGVKTAVGTALGRSKLGGWIMYFISLYSAFCAGGGIGGYAANSEWSALILVAFGFLALFFLLSIVWLSPSAKCMRVMLIVVGVVFLLGFVIIWDDEVTHHQYAYNRALNYMQNGDYEQATEELNYLAEIEYKDCAEKLEECNNWIQYAKAMTDLEESPRFAYQYMFELKGFAPADEMLATPEFQAGRIEALGVGRSVRFGSFYNYERTDKQLQPIIWRILARDGNRALLISLYEIEELPFNDTEEDVGWADCSLRRWLNEDFYNTAFTAAEQSAIELTLVDNTPEEATQDYIFLLSYSEVCKYLPEKSQREVGVTYKHHCEWLLRKLETAGTMVPSIRSGGNFWSNSVAINSACAIRPAMWVVLDPELF